MLVQSPLLPETLIRELHLCADLGDSLCSESPFNPYNVAGTNCADFCSKDKTFAEKIETPF